jgi:hypothetical protein
MAGWVRANRVRLDLDDWCVCASERITVRVISSRRLPPRGGPLSGPLVADPDWTIGMGPESSRELVTVGRD